MAGERAYAAGQFMLVLDATPALISEFDGLNAKADIVVNKQGPSQYAMKHISNFEYDEASFKVGMAMGEPMRAWIQATLDKSFLRKSGTVAAADYNFKAQSYRNFTDALITEIGLPALDASSKDAAVFTIKFKADKAEYGPADNADIKGESNSKQKRWMAANFRIKIGGLDCTSIKKMDAYTIKQKVTADRHGESREIFLEPTGLEFGELKFTLSAKAKIEQQWQKEFERVVHMGDTSSASEFPIMVEWMSHDMKTSLGGITFNNCGWVSLKESKRESGKEGVRELEATFYTEYASDFKLSEK